MPAPPPLQPTYAVLPEVERRLHGGLAADLHLEQLAVAATLSPVCMDLSLC